MRNKIWQKIIACLLSIVLVFTSINPLLFFAYAEDNVTPTPTETITPSPTDLASPQPTAEAETPTPTITPDVTETPTPEATTTPSPFVSPEPTAEAETPTVTIDQSQPEVTPTPTSSQWTFENVELNKEYVAPQNNGVKLIFTKLPTPAGNIKIEEITLTPEQIKQTGSLSDKAYDITSDMADGTFAYNLSLPIPESSKGKTVDVKFAEELSNIGTAEKVDNTLTKTDTSVSVTSLNHFTIFVVSGATDWQQSSGGVCIDTEDSHDDPNGRCFGTIQAAVDAASPSDTINIATGTYAGDVTINKSLTLVGTGNPTATSFTLDSGADLTGSSGITASTINVNEGAKIKDGVSLVSSGGTVNVAAGTYLESQIVVWVNKGFTLQGAGASSTTIDGDNAAAVAYLDTGVHPGTIYVKNPDTSVKIDGFTFINPVTTSDEITAVAVAFGAGAPTPPSITISNNHFIGVSTGSNNPYDNAIWVYSAPTGVVSNITGNEFDNLWQPIYLEQPRGGTVITGNNFHDLFISDSYPPQALSLDAYSGANVTAPVTISSNTFSAFNGWSIVLRGGVSGNAQFVNDVTIENNTITGTGANSAGIVLRNPASTLDNAASSGIVGATISGNTITNSAAGTGTGIWLRGPNNNTTISSNSISGFAKGVLSEQYNVAATSTGVAATNNWWGSANPVFASIISGTVTHDPWYTNAGMTTFSSAKAITGFTIPSQAGSTTINEGSHTINLTMPFGTVVTALVPTISLSNGASVSPNSGDTHNFTTPQVYTVTAADASTQDYTVTVTVAADPIITIFSAISATLTSAGIVNNLDTVTSSNYTNFSGLSFEKRTDVSDPATTIGNITFNSALDLSNNATQTFLQALGSKMQQTNGHIALDVQTAAAFASKGATLTMYNLPPGLTIGKLVVRNDSGTVVDASIVSGFSQNGTTLTFDTTHFTQFDIDTTAPVIAVHGTETAEATSPSGATVNYTAPNATDNIDATAPASCSQASGTTFPIGNTTVNCNKTDTAGNTATPTTFTVTVQDTTDPPNVTTSDAGAFTNNPHLVFTWPASNDTGSGVSYYKFYLNTAASHSSPVPFINGVNVDNVTSYTLTDAQAALLSNGTTYYAMVRAVDNAGNYQTSPGNWSDGITLDTTIPTVSISSPSNSALLNTPAVVLSGTASDATSGVQKVEVSVDSGSYASASGTTSWSFTTSSLSDGAHTITARTTDNAANTNTASISATIDATAPATPVITTVAQPVNTDTIHIVGTAETDSAITITGGASTATGTATGGHYDIAVTLTHNAVNNLSVTAKDTANNVSSPATVAITHDNIAPTVTKLGDNSADVVLNTGDTNLVFTEVLSASSKTAVENALTAGADKTLTYDWSGATLTIHATETTTFANDVVVNVSDPAGNTSDSLLIVDSKLDATQTTPDDSGDATIDNTTPNVVITNPTQAVDLTISSGTTDPTIDVSSFVTGGTGDIPQITITSTAGSGNAAAATIEIPATTVTGPVGWDGVIAAPTVTTVTLPETAGETKTLGSAIEVGFATAKLSFDKAVRILLPGQAGKRAGYSRPGTDFTEITNTCAADDQTTGDGLAADSECKIDVGADLVIWTKHFTKFASYTQTTNSTNSGSGGSDGQSDGLGCGSHDCSPAVATSQSQVLGAFTNQLFAFAPGTEQEVLGSTISEGQNVNAAPSVTPTPENAGQVLAGETPVKSSGQSPLKIAVEVIITLFVISSVGFWISKMRKKA